MGARVAGCAHPLEKSMPGFEDASIHRLFLGWVNLEEFGSLWLRTIFVAFVGTLRRRQYGRVVSWQKGQANRLELQVGCVPALCFSVAWWGG